MEKTGGLDRVGFGTLNRCGISVGCVVALWD